MQKRLHMKTILQTPRITQSNTLTQVFIKTTIIILFGLFLMMIIGCTGESREFALPEGDIEKGKKTFVMMSCNQCHSLPDVEWIGGKVGNTIHVPLGGKVGKVKSYKELVTSIINPSHKILKKYLKAPYATEGKSNMLKYNELMKVEDLVNIVTFLQDKYQLSRLDEIDYYPQW
jgi:cytochrome c2